MPLKPTDPCTAGSSSRCPCLQPGCRPSMTTGRDLPRARLPLRVALIGHTGHGNYGHDLDVAWRAMTADPGSGADLVAVADADARGLEAARQRLGGIPGHADFRAMLAAVRPDIVVVCPRHAHEHRDMIVAAIEAGARGIHVEKPFVRTVAEADEVVALAAARRVAVVIAHRNRYHPALPALVRAVRDGAFGPVIEVRARGKEDQRGGGQDLCVLGGHLFNVATLITGAPIACTAGVSLNGRPATTTDVRDGDEGVGRIVGDEVHARFETASGVPLFFDSTKGAGTGAAGFGVHVFCRDALVDLRMDVEPLIHVQSGSPFVPTRVPRAWVPFSSAGLGAPEPVAGVARLVLGHRGAMEDLLGCVRSGREPICGPVAGREVVEMIQAIFASWAAGGRVTLPLQPRTWPLVGAVPRRPGAPPTRAFRELPLPSLPVLVEDGVDQALEFGGLLDEVGGDARLVVAPAQALVGDVEGREHGELRRFTDRDRTRRGVHRAIDVAGEFVHVRRVEGAAHRVAQPLNVHHDHMVGWSLLAERRLVVHGMAGGYRHVTSAGRRAGRASPPRGCAPDRAPRAGP